MKLPSKKKWLLLVLLVILAAVFRFTAITSSRVAVSSAGTNNCYAPFAIYDHNSNSSQIRWISPIGAERPSARIKGKIRQIACSDGKTCALILEPEQRKDEVFLETSIHTIEPGSNMMRYIAKVKPSISHMQISISAGGDRIAVLQRRSTVQPFGRSVLEVINARGSCLSVLELGQAEYVSNFRWSPKADLLAVVMYDLKPSGSRLPRNRRLILLSSKLLLGNKLTTEPAPDAALAWSPDGQAIAYSVQTPSGVPEVVAEKPGARKPILLWRGTRPDEYVSQLEWLPDAVLILTISNSDRSARLVNVDTHARASRYELLLPSTTSIRLLCDGIVAFTGNKQLEWFKAPVVFGSQGKQLLIEQ